ncbi:MAG: hypothetical protein IJ226_02710 [Clostridia bacterium]|nr:hypothetical protein [Clostridia bacterium]
MAYCILTPFIDTDNENTVLYDYYVYATDRRFNEGLKKDIVKAVDDLQQRNEGIVVKVKGADKVINKNNFIIVYSEEIPDKNIEIYIAKNLEFTFASLPFRTAEMFLENAIYLLTIYGYAVLFSIDIFACYVDIVKAKTKNLALLPLGRRRSWGGRGRRRRL